MKLNQFYTEYSEELYDLTSRFLSNRFLRRGIKFGSFGMDTSVSFEVGSGETLCGFVATGRFYYPYCGDFYEIRVTSEDHAFSTGGEKVPRMDFVSGTRGAPGGEILDRFQEEYDGLMLEAMAFYMVTEDYYQRAVVQNDIGDKQAVVA